MKCLHCGKGGIGLTRRGQAIADGVVCYDCLDKLGFSKSDRTIKPWLLSYWEIENGKDNIERTRYERKKKHEQWMADHPEFQAVLDVLDEDEEADEDESPTDDEEDDI